MPGLVLSVLSVNTVHLLITKWNSNFTFKSHQFEA